MRCAIYTRVSTDEQARSEYSSLERQKEVCASYIEIQKEEGSHLAGVYEDGGYSGKDLSRPGLQELLQDVRDRKIDVVVTYKIDRISRSLKDFYEFWEVLKEHGVSFVSAAQHFDTSDSTGMLMLNILLSFAQFERELTRERTLSKMAGRAEKGLWNG
jgi:DNA invertase Pin-like site-specific DNA recombinase